MASFMIPNGLDQVCFITIPQNMMCANPRNFQPSYSVMSCMPMRSRIRSPLHHRNVVIPERRRPPGHRRPVIIADGTVLASPRHPLPSSRRFEKEDDYFEYPFDLLRLLQLDVSNDLCFPKYGKRVSSDELGEGEKKKIDKTTSASRGGNGKRCDASRTPLCSFKSCPAKPKEQERTNNLTKASESSTVTDDQPNADTSYIEITKRDARKTTEMPFSVSVNVGDFSPEDVNVSIADGRRLVVRARRNEEDSRKRWIGHQEIEYSWRIPDHISIENLNSSFSTDGLLSIAAASATPVGKDISGEESPAAIETDQLSSAEQTTEVTSEKVADDSDDRCAETPMSGEAELEMDVGNNKLDVVETDNSNTEVKVGEE